MSPNQKLIARKFFQLEIHKSNGTAFEQLFASVMQYARPSFNKIKPYGNQGDRGNDGYEKAYGRYFQLYSPENPQHSIADAIKKAEVDFTEKLLPYWSSVCEVKEYFFVFNDNYQGTNFPLEQTLKKIADKHSLSVAEVYLARHLEDEFMRLDEDQMQMIVGGLPAEEANFALDYSILAEVIKHLQNLPLPSINAGKLALPDLDEKIQFNGLGQLVHILKSKQLETWQLDDYLRLNSEFTKQNLRDLLASFYQDSISLHPSESNGELHFAYILDKIAPKTNTPAHDRLRRDVALVIMARYFETCDIFEEPR